eukprot:TRINITY_DN7749_c0_g1_i1.p1 TRINITY_DN7749_c0_g1~~TRINITY_DN7749_c0_g1_i1.p1  ORF type:complete len:155 (+),score=35.23 TRINITY_DN7749_c0_g1_i1:141-605(+)
MVLHCFFLGAGVLCSSLRLGLDAGLVILCWGIQVVAGFDVSVYTSVFIAVRLHRVGRIAYQDWVSGRGDDLYLQTINEATEVVSSQIDAAVSVVESTLDVDAQAVDSLADQGVAHTRSLLDLEFHVVAVLLLVVEFSVLALYLVTNYFDIVNKS